MESGGSWADSFDYFNNKFKFIDFLDCYVLFGKKKVHRKSARIFLVFGKKVIFL